MTEPANKTEKTPAQLIAEATAKSEAQSAPPSLSPLGAAILYVWAEAEVEQLTIELANAKTSATGFNAATVNRAVTNKRVRLAALEVALPELREFLPPEAQLALTE